MFHDEETYRVNRTFGGKMSISVKDIAAFLVSKNIKHEIYGDFNVLIHGFCPLNSLQDNCITWIRNLKKISFDDFRSHKNIILFAENTSQKIDVDLTIVYVDNVQKTFFEVTEHFFGHLNPDRRQAVIEKTSVVESDNIGEGVYIGHHTFIDREVSIGNHVTIMHNVTIQGKVEIGDDSFIESGTVIGACGFGYVKDDMGKPKLVPHYAGVKIGKEVHIGANNTIIRGCLGDTIIEDYVKTADLVCISHNDVIKSGALLTCGVMIAGSTTVGENTWLAPGAVINNAVDIGDDSYVGIGSVVLKKVKPGRRVFGVPAVNIN